jgi:hypothetical protein
MMKEMANGMGELFLTLKAKRKRMQVEYEYNVASLTERLIFA